MSNDSRDSVLVIGSVSADVTTFSSRLPAPGETFLGDEFTLVMGGKGANQAVAAARALGGTAEGTSGGTAESSPGGTPGDAAAGGDAYFVGCVGNDIFAPLVLDGLRDAGVNTSHLRQVADQTGIAHIRVDASGENDIVVVPNANNHLSAAQIDAAIAAVGSRCAVLLTQLEIPRELAAHAVRAAAAAGIRVVLDPAPAAALPAEIWQHVDIVTPNETEATMLSGVQVVDRATAVAAGEWFIAQGVQHALITLAGAGCVLVTADGHEFFAPFKVDPVDTTAAGDAFAGYLAAALATGKALPAAIRVASAAGALAVTKKGASPSLPTATEVAEFLARPENA
ncbi:ribokinase [Leucobacter sp. OH2974_COT-288]|nr:ribokinase [Leucobacter sp. OH2974_COT-288]